MATEIEQGPPGAGENPLVACARQMTALLDQAAEVDPMYLSTADKSAVLRALSTSVHRTRGLLMRVLATAGDVAEETGARSAAAWLGHHTRTPYPVAAAEGRLAEALDSRYRHLQAGVLAGDVSVDQAAAIVAALDRLPGHLDAETREKAELHLVEQAAFIDPPGLRVLGRRILEIVAPEIAEDEERRQLEAEERHARETTRLTMRSRGDGTTDVSIRLADAAAHRLRTYLEAYAAPRRGHLDPAAQHTDPASGERIGYPVLLGRAFCSMLEAIPSDRLPRHGGSPTTVVVTIDLERLRQQVGAAGLMNGQRISATEALRLACTAGIVPAVLNGRREVLHLGRSRRDFSDAQRLALMIRDQECRAEGCTIPGDWCEAHHAGTSWADGGDTDIEDGALLCPWHHHRAHDPDYTTERLPDGDFRFRKRRRS